MSLKTPKIEQRTFKADALAIEARAADGGTTMPMIKGHAAVFDQLSEDLGGYQERIAPGAFAKSLSGQDIRSLWNHNPDYVLGRQSAKTLSLSEDSKGLAVEIDPPDTQWARDLCVSMRRGDIKEMSFSFITISDKWAKLDGAWVRTLLEVELIEVSPVTFPAYPQTDVSARALDGLKRAQEEDARENPQPRTTVPLSVRRLELDLLN